MGSIVIVRLDIDGSDSSAFSSDVEERAGGSSIFELDSYYW